MMIASPLRTLIPTTSRGLLRQAAPTASRASVAPISYRSLHSTLPRLQEPTASTTGEYKNILVSSPSAGVTLITLNRPKALNALNSELMTELNAAARLADDDASVNAIVLTGGEKAFAAGADIKEMQNMTFSSAYKQNFLGHWSQLSTIRKPIIAAISKHALGGGCELAMMCDILLADSTATFGQPEINLGVIPGAGGSQRFTKAVGKSIAMEMVLTGRTMNAEEAAQRGLVSRVVPEGTSVIEEAIKVATSIGKKSQVAVQAGKEAVNASFELPLGEGLKFERRLFQSLFATKDQKEGMGAFAEKRKPKFANE